MIDLEITIKGEELKQKLNLKDGVDGKNGENGAPGAPGKDATVDEAALAERATKKLEEELPALGTSVRDGLELLQGDERLDKKAVKGLEDIEKKLKEVGSRSYGGGLTRMVGDQLYVTNTGLSKTLTYNTDGTLNVMTDAMGTKTMIWSSGTLTGFIGTGFYRSKSFTYSSGALTAVTVS